MQWSTRTYHAYCINVYGCAYTTSLQRLRVKQKESIRIVNNVGYRDHTPLLFKENQILPLDDMIKFAKLKFMHCYANLKLPLSFHGIWPQNRDVNPAMLMIYVSLPTTLLPSNDCPCSTFPKLGMKKKKENPSHLSSSTAKRWRSPF